MLSIQTNLNSLVAHQNLNVNSAFESKTILQLTSVSKCLTDNGGGTGKVTFTRPGFGDAGGITISPNLTGVTTQRSW
jgi:hypothetical protein